MLKLLFLHPLFLSDANQFSLHWFEGKSAGIYWFYDQLYGLKFRFSLKPKLEDWGNDNSMYSRTVI